MFTRTDDPVRDAEYHYTHLPRIQPRRQKCEYCEKEIKADHAFDIEDVLICPECLVEYMEHNYRVRVKEEY